MNQLRLDADTANQKVEELQEKIKALEQENLSKEQEITSLQHKNGVLEGQVDKLEGDVDKHKKLADEGSGSITQNEALQRRLQLLEEEAEEADKTLRETNEKFVHLHLSPHTASPSRSPHVTLQFIDAIIPHSAQASRKYFALLTTHALLDFDRPMSRPDTSSGRCRLSRTSVTSGRPSTRRCRRSTPTPRRRSRSSSGRSVPSDRASSNDGRRHVRGRRRFTAAGRKAVRERLCCYGGKLWEGWPDIVSSQNNASVNELLGFMTRHASRRRVAGLICLFVSGRQPSLSPTIACSLPSPSFSP